MSSILDRRAARDAKREANPNALTLAGRNALAYVAIIGNTAKGTHIDTRLAVLFYTEDGDYSKTRRFYKVKPEHVAEYEGAPLWRTHAALIAAGFQCRGNIRVRNGGVVIESKILYERIDAAGMGFQAKLYRDGGLYVNAVRGHHVRWGNADSEYVSRKHAGTLGKLIAGAS